MEGVLFSAIEVNGRKKRERWRDEEKRGEERRSQREREREREREQEIEQERERAREREREEEEGDRSLAAPASLESTHILRSRTARTGPPSSAAAPSAPSQPAGKSPRQTGGREHTPTTKGREKGGGERCEARSARAHTHTLRLSSASNAAMARAV
eukprot:2280450-Rhodomonas_salina.2